MIKCIAIDDEPLALRQICEYIEKTPYLHLSGVFIDALDALAELKKENTDLVFIDIHMPDISGIDLVKALNNPPKIIFTTAFREYAAEGFQLDAADYLLKPIAYNSFLKSVERTKQRYFPNNEKQDKAKFNQDFLFIKSEYKIIRINYANINYIEGMRDYVRIHTCNQKPIMALMGMKKIMQHLPQKQFMRVHRSYIINLNKIQTIERNQIIFDGNVFIPISEQYKNPFHCFLENNFLK